MGHGGRRDGDGVAFDGGVGPIPFVVVAGYGEFLGLVAFDDEAAVGVGEVKADGVFAAVDGFDGWSLIDDVLAVEVGECAIGEALAYGELVFGVDVVRIAGVDGDGEA